MTQILTALFGAVTGTETITLTETQRALLLEKGRFAAILGPGTHRVPRSNAVIERHDIDRLRFVSGFDRALFRTRPDLAEPHLTEVTTGPDEIALITRDGKPVEVLMPDARIVLWRDAGPFEVERLGIADDLTVAPQLARRLIAAGFGAILAQFRVLDGHVGMLFVEGVLAARLDPGLHAFWARIRDVTVKMVDLRARAHEVTGQEILTKDRVTIRVNLTALFRVTDAERAVTAVRDFDEALHRALQLALRRQLGAQTLDQILADKGEGLGFDAVRAEMAGIGIDLGEVALKDVILPGEMREILNRVVTAEKEAEANVIRRREETNATRSLLNTAKVMAENPVMLRLKELEALETIAGKVQHLTVHNGTRGLLDEVATLRD